MASLCVQVAKASNPTQVEAKEVQLSDIAPIMLDDTDVKTVRFIYSDWELWCTTSVSTDLTVGGLHFIFVVIAENR